MILKLKNAFVLSVLLFVGLSIGKIGFAYFDDPTVPIDYQEELLHAAFISIFVAIAMTWVNKIFIVK